MLRGCPRRYRFGAGLWDWETRDLLLREHFAACVTAKRYRFQSQALLQALAHRLNAGKAFA